MKRALWGLLILLTLVVTGCGAGGKVNGADPGTDPATGAGPVETVTLAGVSSLIASGSNPGNTASSQSILRATVTNAAGLKVASQVVTFYSDGGGTFTPSNSVTDSNGDGVVEVTFTAPSTLGPVTIYALSGLARSDDKSITIINGPVSTLRVYPQKNQAGFNESVDVDIYAYDANNYPVANKSLTVTVDPNNSGTVRDTLGVPTTDAFGKATVAYLSGSTAGTDTIKVDSGIAGVVGTKTINVTQAATTIKSFTLTSSNTTLLANGTSFVWLEVEILDTLNVGVSGVDVTFETDNGSLDNDSVLNATPVQIQTVATGTNGKARVYLFSADAVSTARVNVSAAAYSDSLDFNFTVGTPDTVVLTASPDALGPKLTSTLTALVKDAAGHYVAAGTPVNFEVTTNNTGATLPAIATANTNSFGRATLVYTAGATPGTDTITATTNNNKSGTETITSSVANVTVATVSSTAAKSTLTADGSDSVALEVKVLDIDGKPAVGKSVTFAEILRNGAVAGTLTPAPPAITNATGVAKITYRGGNKSGDVQLTASCDGVSSSVTLNLVAGTPTKLYASWDGVLDGTGDTSAALLTSAVDVNYYAKLLDANDNPVAGTSISFLFGPSGNKSGGVINDSAIITNAYGEVNGSYAVGSIGDVTDTIKVTSSGLTTTLTAVIDQNPPSSVVVTAETTLVADGADTVNPAASDGTVTAIVKDKNGNLLVGETVTFSSRGGGVFDNGSGGNTATTDANGEAQITFTAPDTLGKVKVYAMCGTRTSNLFETTITNGPVATIRVFPADSTVGPQGVSDVLLLATDSLGYPVSAATLSVSVTINNSGINVELLGTPTTDANGQAHVTYTAGNTEGTDTLTASYGSINGTAQIVVSQAAASIKSFTLTTPRVELVGNGVDYTSLKVTIIDNNNNGVAGIAVDFTSDYGLLDKDVTLVGGTAVTQSVTTDSNGEAVVYLVAPVGAGTGTVTVKAATGDFKQQEFTFTAGSVAAVTLSAAPTTIAPGGVTTLTATVVDATLPTANPVPGQTVTFLVTTNVSHGALTATTATTDAEGKATVTYTAGIASGSDVIKVTTANGKTDSETIIVSASAVVVGSVTLQSTKTSLPADNSSTALLTAKVLDTDGLPAAGKKITVTEELGSILTPDADAALGIQVITDAAGEAIISYKAGTAIGAGSVTVDCEGMLATVGITLTAGTPTKLEGSFDLATFDPATALDLISGVQQTIYARVTDANANPVSGATVAFAFNVGQNPSTATLSAASAKTDVNGIATVNYTAGTIASVTDTVTMTLNGLTNNKLKVNVTPRVASITLTYGDKATTVVPDVVGGKSLKIYARIFSDVAETVPAVNVDVTASFPLVDDNQSGATVTPLSAVSDADGYVIFTFTAGPTLTDVTDRITVSAGGVSQSGSIPVKSVVDKINLFYRDLSTAVPLATAVPNYILTGSGASTAVFAQVLDGLGDPVAGVTVTFAFLVGDNNSNVATITPASFVTDAKGFATATYKAGIDSGINDVLTVSVGTLSAEATFKVDPVVTTILFDKEEIIVDAASTDSLTITLKDQKGDVMGGTDFVVTYGGGVNPSVDNGITAADGTFTLDVDDPDLENTTLTVTAGGISKTIPVYAGAVLQLTPASANAPADGVTKLTYTATLRDYAGVVLAGLPIHFSGANSVTLSTGLVLTNASGNATVDVRSTIFTPVDAFKEVTAKAGALTAEADAVFEPGPATSIVLSVPVGANPLSLGGGTTITATITDALGNPVKSGTVVNFALDGTIGSVTAQAVTSDATGIVTVPFQAGMKSGSVTVTATSATATGTIGLTIEPSAAGIIELSAIEPATRMINIRGSGTTQSATIYFIVKDGAGNPVADGTTVYFTLPIATAASVAAGGEAIATTTIFAEAVNGTTVNGIASVTLRSGMMARTVGVTAMVITSYVDVDLSGGYTAGDTITGSISTEARVTIVGGKPDSQHISLAAEKLNVAGGITFGLKNNITAFLGDRFSNVPLDGTPVSFYSECGTIGDSTGFVLSTVGGQVTATMTTQNPMTPNLAGIPWDVDGDGTIEAFEAGNVGICTVLAALPGEESYVDANADGVYKAADGDVCTGDQGEPYIDGNDSGDFEAGEFFVDSNNDGNWDGPDGNCSGSTMIWTDINVMMSSYPAHLYVTPYTFSIPIGGWQEFNLNLSDIFGNALVAGSTINISADGGTLGGIVDYTVPDYVGYGNWYSEDSNGNGVLDANDRGVDINGDGIPDAGVPIRFWLSADVKADAEAKAVKITITSTPGAGAAESITIGGTINTTGSWSRMSVTSAASSVSAGTGTSVTATLTDAIGVPVQGATVNFSTNPSNIPLYGTFLPLSGVTNASGQVTTTYTAGSQVGFVDLVASAAGGDYVGSTIIQVIPAAATQVTLSLSDAAVTAGGQVTATALVQDIYNNPVANQTVTFSVPTNNTLGSLDSTSQTTNSFGLATVTYTSGVALSAASESDTLRAAIPGDTSDASLTVNTPASAAENIVVNLSATTLVADGISPATATAFVSDDSGQAVPGVEVVFSTTLGTIAPLSVFTNASGLASATLTAGTVTGNGTVQATVGILSDSSNFTLTPGPAATLTNFLASPSTVKPSGNTTISVRVVDANNNPVADGTFVSFAVTTNNSGGYLLSTTDTTVSGNASVVYRSGNNSLVDTITISSPPAGAQTVTVTVDSGLSSIDAMSISASPLTLSNNGTDSSLITSTVTKAGVPVAGIPVSFANPEANGSLFTTGGGAYAGAIYTDDSGQAQVVFRSGLTQGTASVTSTFGGFTKTAVLSIVETVANVVVTVDNDQIVANGTSTTPVTATVTDILGAPLSGITVNFSTTRGSLSAATDVTDATGQASVTLTSTALLGTAMVTANYGAISDTAPVQFVVGPPATVTMTGSPTTIAYGGQTSLTVSVVDSQTRPVPNANLYFGFSPTAAAGNLSGGSYSLTSGTTDAQGRLTLIYTAGTPALAVIDNLLVETEVTGVTDILPIAVNPAAATVGAMQLSLPTLSSIVANGVTTTQLAALVLDEGGSPMSGVPVSFATTYGTLSAASVNTNASGLATVTLTSTTTVGTAYVTATTGGFQGQQPVNFIPGNPVWKDGGGIVVSSLAPTSSSLAADNISSTEVKAVLKDAHGNLVADGTSVTLLSTLGVITANPVLTVNGVATFTVTATRVSGTSILSLAEVTGLTSVIEFGVNNGANIGGITLEAVLTNLTVAGAGQPSNTTVTISAFESDGTPIDESFWGANNTIRVQFLSHPDGSEFIAGVGGVCSNPAFTTESTCVTPATWQAGQQVSTIGGTFIDVRTLNGVATVTVQAGTLPGVIELSATALDETGALTDVTASLTTIVAAGPPHSIVLIPGVPQTPSSTTGLITRPSTIIATDRFGNAVPDGTILNLGLIDTVLAAGSGDASTNAAILDGTFALNDRDIAANDLVLITNAAQTDRKRFIVSGLDAPFTVDRNYNNLVAGGLDAYVGAAIQGGSVTGDTGAVGWTTTVGGIAVLDVNYPEVLTAFNAGAGYGCAGIIGSEGVFVVVSSADGAVHTINEGGFCFSP